MTTMRAKMVVVSVSPASSPAGVEVLSMSAVAKSGPYPEDGHDDDNTYARWSPAGSLTLHVANPNLHGKFVVGEKFYLDVTKAE